MKIDHGTIGGVPLEETFTFDPEAGLALASVTSAGIGQNTPTEMPVPSTLPEPLVQWRGVSAPDDARHRVCRLCRAAEQPRCQLFLEGPTLMGSHTQSSPGPRADSLQEPSTQCRTRLDDHSEMERVPAEFCAFQDYMCGKYLK
jgi:hypothetical protein